MYKLMAIDKYCKAFTTKKLLNADPIATDEAGYPKDAFLQQPQYNIPVAGDEYIFPLDHDKYTNLDRDLALRKGEAGKTIPLKIFGHMVSLTGDPINGCLQLGAKIAAESTNAYIVIPGSCAYRLPLAVT